MFKRQYLQGVALLAGVGLAACGLAGCSAQQTYMAGQTWQRNECQRLNDAQARAKCLESANASFDAYQRQLETEAKTKRD